jgi:hypothetical protein
MDMYVDSFGWIPRPLDLQWSFGQLRTLPEFDDAVASLKTLSDYAGYLHPPIENVGSWRDPQETSYPICSVSRPASLHKVPPTHELCLPTVSDDPTVLRSADGGFLIHFLGFLLGYRCQFWDWWVDSRVSIRSHTDYHIVREDSIGKCLDLGTSSWRQWNEHTRTIFINAMFLHNRSSGYLWDWERLQAEYQVLDAFYAVARSRFKLPPSPHRQRIELLCRHFGLYGEQDLANSIVSLRNDLIHEALWSGQMPCTAPDEDSFYAPIWLHKFNQRLGLAILGFANDYVHSRWNGLGTIAFSI